MQKRDNNATTFQRAGRAKNNEVRSRHAGNNCWLRISVKVFVLTFPVCCQHVRLNPTVNNCTLFLYVGNVIFAWGTFIRTQARHYHIVTEVQENSITFQVIHQLPSQSALQQSPLYPRSLTVFIQVWLAREPDNRRLAYLRVNHCDIATETKEDRPQLAISLTWELYLTDAQYKYGDEGVHGPISRLHTDLNTQDRPYYSCHSKSCDLWSMTVLNSWKVLNLIKFVIFCEDNVSLNNIIKIPTLRASVKLRAAPAGFDNHHHLSLAALLASAYVTFTGEKKTKARKLQRAHPAYMVDKRDR